VKSPLTLTLPLRGGRGGWGRTIRFVFYATLRLIKKYSKQKKTSKKLRILFGESF